MNEMDSMAKMMAEMSAGCTPAERAQLEQMMAGFNSSSASTSLDSTPIDEVIEQVRDLPLLSTPGTRDFSPEIWSVSYTSLHNNAWMVTICVEHMGKFNDTMIMQGQHLNISETKPSKEFVLRVLLDCMLKPAMPVQTGPPHRPIQLFLAYRLHKSYQYIKEQMAMVNVICVLEEEGEALITAAEHGTDPTGRNGFRCDNCNAAESDEKRKFNRCANCKSVRYCSKECQTSHWKTGGHNKECKRIQAGMNK